MSEGFLSKQQSKRLFYVALSFVSLFGVLSLGLLGVSIYDRYTNINDDTQLIAYDQNGEVEVSVLIRQMEEIEKRADSSVTSAELILSFLEGATVLLGIAVGAAALYGFNQVSDIRNSLKEDIQHELDQIKLLKEELSQINDVRKFIQAHSDDIERLPQVTDLQIELENQKKELATRVENVTWLLQANQEFGLNNHQQAYGFATHVLENDNQNPLALYIAGWLEGVYLDKLDQGIEHLKTLSAIIDSNKNNSASIEENTDNEKVEIWGWATAQAAYGVLLRKQGRELLKADDTKEDGNRILRNALHILKTVLETSPNLMDFNQESFWGPVGGIYRALEEWENGMNAYRDAMNVTPRSSYPQGNYASLCLRVYQEENKPSDEGQATVLGQFEQTIAFAQAELLQKPADYYLLMDLAMPDAILNPTSKVPAGNVKDYLQQALDTKPSVQMLETSLIAGWQFLLESCPDDWTDVQTALKNAIQRMEDAIESAKKAAEEAKSKLENTESNDDTPHQS